MNKKIVKTGIIACLLIFTLAGLAVFGLFKLATSEFTIHGNPNDALSGARIGKKILDISPKRSGLAQGYTYQVWHIVDTERHINESCSTERITNKAVWVKCDNDRHFQKVLASFEAQPEFTAISDRFQDILSDPNSMHCYTYIGAKMKTPSPAIGYYWGVTLWICSPKQKLIMYLDFKD